MTDEQRNLVRIRVRIALCDVSCVRCRSPVRHFLTLLNPFHRSVNDWCDIVATIRSVNNHISVVSECLVADFLAFLVSCDICARWRKDKNQIADMHVWLHASRLYCEAEMPCACRRIRHRNDNSYYYRYLQSELAQLHKPIR